MNRTSMMCSTSSSSPIYIEVVFPKRRKKYIYIYVCIYMYLCIHMYVFIFIDVINKII